jgi:hypothetical protein
VSKDALDAEGAQALLALHGWGLVRVEMRRWIGHLGVVHGLCLDIILY